jgi:hypothetical protein
MDGEKLVPPTVTCGPQIPPDPTDRNKDVNGVAQVLLFLYDLLRTTPWNVNVWQRIHAETVRAAPLGSFKDEFPVVRHASALKFSARPKRPTIVFGVPA